MELLVAVKLNPVCQFCYLGEERLGVGKTLVISGS